MKGYLRKKNRHGMWQQRYFECANAFLNYFPDAKKRKLLASLSLVGVRECELIDPFEATFYIELVDGTRLE